MSWNDDSDKKPNDPKDPWSGKNKNQGPPDIDQVLKEVSKKFSRLFSFSKKKSSGGGSNNNGENDGETVRHTWLIALVILVVFILIWFASGFFIVQPAEQAVVLRFGKYYETQNPGLHWIPRFVDSKTVINIQQVNTFGYQSEMLTEDENIVSVEIAVQYQISNPYNFLYKVADPIETLQQATASALRQVVGNMTLDTVLTTGRQNLSAKVDEQLNQTLAIYQTGVKIVAVTLQPTKPPEQVTAAFNDAIRAREDEVRYQNQADAYASKVVPIASGQAKRILAEANAYEQQVVLQAKAHVASFNALLPQYKRAPEVTRERMYLSAVQSVLQKSSKVLIATNKGGHNLMYLPLEKLLTLPNTNSDDSSQYSETQVAAAASTVATMPELPSGAPSSNTTPPPSSYTTTRGYNFNNQGGSNESN